MTWVSISIDYGRRDEAMAYALTWFPSEVERGEVKVSRRNGVWQILQRKGT